MFSSTCPSQSEHHSSLSLQTMMLPSPLPIPSSHQKVGWCQKVSARNPVVLRQAGYSSDQTGCHRQPKCHSVELLLSTIVWVGCQEQAIVWLGDSWYEMLVDPCTSWQDWRKCWMSVLGESHQGQRHCHHVGHNKKNGIVLQCCAKISEQKWPYDGRQHALWCPVTQVCSKELPETIFALHKLHTG